MMRIYIVFALSLVGCFVLRGQTNKQPVQAYHLVFQNNAGDSVLHIDSVYQNHSGEAFTIRSLKYYVSHIQLHYKDGYTYNLKVPPHLVNEADSGSKNISFDAPLGAMASIQFLLGIDSITNVGGVQTGDLDPVKGMFWIWNTGYIIAKLEGSSSASKAPGKQFSYDVGGYKTGENVTKQINLSLSQTGHQQTSRFIITADIGKWFYGESDIKIAEQPMCHSPGTLAMQIANNYANMFSLRAE